MVLPYVFGALFCLWLASIPFIVTYYRRKERAAKWNNYAEWEIFRDSVSRYSRYIWFRSNGICQ